MTGQRRHARAWGDPTGEVERVGRRQDLRLVVGQLDWRRLAPDAPVPGNPDYAPPAPQAAPPPLPAPLSPPVWDLMSAQDLLNYVEQVGKDMAETTAFWNEALNEILAGGKKVF